jgi:TolB-like protein
MVEVITTAIARSPWLFVIARNSAFTYKGKPADVKQVAQELGVRRVLEGSVRKAGNRMRITGQLIDTMDAEPDSVIIVSSEDPPRNRACGSPQQRWSAGWPAPT